MSVRDSPRYISSFLVKIGILMGKGGQVIKHQKQIRWWIWIRNYGAMSWGRIIKVMVSQLRCLYVSKQMAEHKGSRVVFYSSFLPLSPCSQFRVIESSSESLFAWQLRENERSSKVLNIFAVISLFFQNKLPFFCSPIYIHFQQSIP